MTVISDKSGSLARYPTVCAKNYYTKTFLKITMTIVSSDFFRLHRLLFRASRVELL